MVSLEYLVKIYLSNKVGNEVFDEIFAYLSECKNKDFQTKAFDALEKLLCRNKNKRSK
jgi:hypothetical protein